MGPSNVEIFDTICAALLVHLYENFPNRVDVKFADLQLIARLPEDDADAVWDWAELFSETTSWLGEEGFIRFQTGTDDGEYFGVRLTMQGLTLLQALPPSLEQPTEPFIKRLKRALGEGGKVASVEALRTTLDALFKSAGVLAG